MADTPTTAQEIYDSFEASFQDKCVIPEELEKVWLLKAVGRYSIELSPIIFNEDENVFDTKLDRYTIDTLGAFMKQSYQERETSKVNKRVSIVGKDISVNGNGYDKVAARNELEYDRNKSAEMVDNVKPTAYV
jgi:hypothetical protein